MRIFLLVIVPCVLFLGLAGCGGGGDGDDSGVPDNCIGAVCNNCATDPACDISCPPGEVNWCGDFGYFSDPDLRCSWCGPDTE